MLSNLETKNFKKIGDKEIEFNSGLNVLRGPNWSGKSTILNAIKFALQGVQGIPGNCDDIPTWDSKGKCSSTIYLNGYTISRSLADCNIYKQGSDKPVATGHTACNSFLDELFGIPVAHYNTLHFSDQGETAGLLTIGATRLQKIVEKISGVDLIDKVLKLTSSDTQVLKGRLDGKEIVDTKSLNSEVTTKELELKAKVEEMEKLVESIKWHKPPYEAAVSELKEKSDLVVEYNASKENIVNIKLAINKYLARLEALEDIVNNPIEPADFMDDLITELKEKIKIDSRVIELEKNVNSRHKVVKDWLENSSASALDIETKWNDEVKTLQDLISGLEFQYSALTHKVATLNEDKDKLEFGISNSICIECNRPYDDLEDHASDQEEKLLITKELLDKQNTEMNRLAKEKNQKSKELNSLVVEPPANQGVEETITNFNIEMDSLSNNLTTAEELEKKVKELASFEEELINLKAKKIAAADSYAKYTEAVSKYETLLSEKNPLELQLKELEGEDLATEKLELRVTELAKIKLDLSTKLIGFEGKLETCEAVKGFTEDAVIAAKRELHKGIKANDIIKSDRKSKTEIEALAKYLRESRSRFLTTTWDRILGYASTFCKTCTNDEVQGVVRDERGKFKFIEDGVHRPVAAASGAQKAFMGVGVRLGLAKALYGSSSFMVLDEPSSDMSVENSTRLVSTLMSTSIQIIYSTHSDLEELAAGNVIDLGEM